MILLFSGGVDSYIAWHFLYKPQTLYFNLHTKYSEIEKDVVRQLIPNTIMEDCIDFSAREATDGSAFVPYRNLHLALFANKYSDNIVIAGLKDDKVSDKNEDAFRQFSDVMSKLSGRAVNVYSPFFLYTKEQIVHWYIHEYKGSMDELYLTISCYDGSHYCGKCPACFRKWCAFRANGIPMYPFTNEELMEEYYQKALAGTHYIPERNANIIKQVERFRRGE